MIGAAPRLALAVAGGALLSGCAAAAIPIAAAGAGAYKIQDRPKRQRAAKPARAPKPGQVVVAPDGTRVQVTGMAALPPPSGAAAPTAAPAGVQFLYGSGEAAALSFQAYGALWNYLRVEIGYLRDKSTAREVVLQPGSTLDNPRFGTCGKRPMAVVLDVDETVLLNLGFEGYAASGVAPDPARWGRWEQSGATKVAAVPGAAEALAAARREGFTIVFNSNRSAGSASQTAAAIEHAGLGPAVPGDTLWLREAGSPSGKDARRARIAQRYCVVALAGDQLGDFSDLFNADGTGVSARRNSVGGTLLAPLWGSGWFMLPNPLYGTGLKGSIDEIIPPESRWTDPEEKK